MEEKYTPIKVRKEDWEMLERMAKIRGVPVQELLHEALDLLTKKEKPKEN